MLPSIKESDRYAFTDRIHLALSGLALTILGAASSAALLQYTLFYSHTAAVVLPPLLFAGPIVLCISCCARYKGKIKVIHKEQQGWCRECCTEGPLEVYEELMDGHHTQNKLYTLITKVHCPLCGHVYELTNNLATAARAQRQTHNFLKKVAASNQLSPSRKKLTTAALLKRDLSNLEMEPLAISPPRAMLNDSWVDVTVL